VKVLYVADGQSPHSVNWIRLLVDQGVEAHLVTSYPVDEGSLPVQSLHYLPWDFSATVRKGEKGSGFGAKEGKKSPLTRLRGGKAWQVLVNLRSALAPIVVKRQSRKLREIIQRVKPDMVHAMRLPYEGYMAAIAMKGIPVPLLISTWGNDFSLYAEKGGHLAKFTREAMARTDGLHPDCEKDLRLANNYGFDRNKPSAVLPGNGGIDPAVFYSGAKDLALLEELAIPVDAPLIVNPRGIKPYVRTDTFFAAIPKVLAQYSQAHFVGVAMADKPAIQENVEKFDCKDNTSFTRALTHKEMGRLLRSSSFILSLAEHDGTPNSVLESMACGAFPIVGDIESLREWIKDGENGLLVDPASPESTAAAVIRALADTALVDRASILNAKICERITRTAVGPKAIELYRKVARVE
jgi:glycosyltransferase involved in cell wall biosynthesis